MLTGVVWPQSCHLDRIVGVRFAVEVFPHVHGGRGASDVWLVKKQVLIS